MEFRHKRWPLTPPRPLSAPMRVTDTSDRAKIREELHQKERRRLEAFISNTPPLSNIFVLTVRARGSKSKGHQ